MGVHHGNAEARSCSEINMTPLIDVMLVLLIIFIITLPPVTHAVRIDHPAPTPDRPVVPPVVIDLSIDFDGTLAWDRQTIDRTTLRDRVRSEASRSPQPEVHLSIDRFVRYETVAQTLADLQFLGLQNVAFVDVGYR